MNKWPIELKSLVESRRKSFSIITRFTHFEQTTSESNRNPEQSTSCGKQTVVAREGSTEWGQTASVVLGKKKQRWLTKIRPAEGALRMTWHTHTRLTRRDAAQKDYEGNWASHGIHVFSPRDLFPNICCPASPSTVCCLVLVPLRRSVFIAVLKWNTRAFGCQSINTCKSACVRCWNTGCVCKACQASFPVT